MRIFSRVFFPARRAGKKTLLIGLVLGLLLSGCEVLWATTEPFPTASPTPTITLTPTIQWFPSTSTLTPGVQRPQLAATPNQRPALGEVLLRDSFTDPLPWQTFDSAAGTIRVAQGQLTLSAPEAAANLVSLRRGVLPDDFYAEVTSFTRLCRGKDTYGLVFRSDGGVAQYRLLVSCDGFLRMERWRASEAAVLQDWLPSGQIRTGGPQLLRLGVWAVGSEFRIFVNDAFQFSVRDALLKGQQIGVLLRSTGANAATVSFSDLSVQRIQGFVPTPIPSTTPVITILATRAPTLTPQPTK